MLKVSDLRKEAKRFLEENYGLRLLLPIHIEPTTEGKQGCYMYTKRGPKRIIIADFTVRYGTDAVVFGVLHHELVHYAMHRLHKPFCDGDPEFEAELERLGVPHTEQTVLGEYYLYQCSGCGEEVPSFHYFHEEVLDKVVTECCEAKPIDMHRIAVYNGEERVS